MLQWQILFPLGGRSPFMARTGSFPSSAGFLRRGRRAWEKDESVDFCPKLPRKESPESWATLGRWRWGIVTLTLCISLLSPCQSVPSSPDWGCKVLSSMSGDFSQPGAGALLTRDPSGRLSMCCSSAARSPTGWPAPTQHGVGGAWGESAEAAQGQEGQSLAQPRWASLTSGLSANTLWSAAEISPPSSPGDVFNPLNSPLPGSWLPRGGGK